MTGPLDTANCEADSVNSDDPGSSLATKCPQRRRVPGAGEEAVLEAQSPASPKEAHGGIIRAALGREPGYSLQNTSSRAVATSWAFLECSGISPLSSLWTHPGPADRPGSVGLVPSPSD